MPKAPKGLIRDISLAKQKIIFYLSYIKTNWRAIESELIEEVKLFKDAYISGKLEAKKAQEMSQKKASPKKKPLIEEV